MSLTPSNDPPVISPAVLMGAVDGSIWKQTVKPELVLYDGTGRYEIAEGRSRVLQGASWKRQRIVVVIPAGPTIPSRVALSHWSLQFPQNNHVARILALGQEVGEAYSNAIAQIVAHPEFASWEYILTIEHDNMPPPDGLLRLLDHCEAHPEYAAIGGLYFTIGPGGVAQIWGDPADPTLNFRPRLPDPNGGLIECCGTGMGFTLFRIEMFKDAKLRRPWFRTMGNGTQDLYAWTNFHEHGYRCAVACDVHVGHYDPDGKRGGIADFVW